MSKSSNKTKTILVTGGAGYVGCVLVPKLLKNGYKVIVYDLMIYGDSGLQDHKNLKIIKGDIRNTKQFKKICINVDTIIHLATIPRDPHRILNPVLAKSINWQCFKPLVNVALNAKVKRFILASTSSVYGYSNAKSVNEKHKINPKTDYSKYKSKCEKILLNNRTHEFIPIVVRPVTVAGFSPRLRLDLTLNSMVNAALENHIIQVNGGSQIQPQIHIDDICDIYIQLIEAPAKKVSGQIFNIGFNSPSLFELATVVKNLIENKYNFKNRITILKNDGQSKDRRSYNIDSNKISKVIKLKKLKSIRSAAESVFKSLDKKKKSKLSNNLVNYNLMHLKKLEAFLINVNE